MNAVDFDKRPMPKIARAHAVDLYSVEIVWAAGPRADRTEIVDLRPAMDRYKAYAPLRNWEAFSALELADDGTVIAWCGGGIDMAATSVEHLAELQMTGRQFSAFLARHNLTRSAAAAEFGKSLRCIQTYATAGEEILPREFALACRGYEFRALPMNAHISGTLEATAAPQVAGPAFAWTVAQDSKRRA